MWKHLGASTPEAVDAFCSRYADALDDATLEVAALLDGDAAARWVEGLGEPVCLWHGDYRLTNLLFDVRDGERPLAVVDWKGVTMAAGSNNQDLWMRIF